MSSEQQPGKTGNILYSRLLSLFAAREVFRGGPRSEKRRLYPQAKEVVFSI